MQRRTRVTHKKEETAAAPRRGRPLRTAERGFGSYLEGVMRLQHALEAPQQGFSQYLAGLYESSRAPGISLRHLMRLRRAQDIPSFATLRRIAQAFPAVGEFESAPGQDRFKEELWAPRLGWSAVRQQWQLLPRRSDISLCMGLLPAWALERLTGPIVHDIGEAIAARELTFNFVFPGVPGGAGLPGQGADRELSADEIIEDARLSVAQAALRSGSDSAPLRARIRTHLRAWEVKPLAESMYFWSRCPRALMISNLFRASHGESDFAAAYELNQVPYPASFVHRFDPPLPPPITSAGWGYLLPQSHQRLRQLFSWLREHHQVVRRPA
jgi:hypothetical protein